MSIIQEALKKAQNDHVKSEEPIAAAKTDPAAPAPVTPIFARKPLNVSKASQSRIKSIPLALMIMVAFAAVVFTANHFFMSRGVDVQNSSNTVVVKKAQESRQEFAYKAPEKKAEPVDVPTLGDLSKTLPISRLGSVDAPSFVLNGIMYLEAGPKAIIDGNVVREGDLIKGAIVKTINKNSVILNYRDLEISLNLKD